MLSVVTASVEIRTVGLPRGLEAGRPLSRAAGRRSHATSAGSTTRTCLPGPHPTEEAGLHGASAGTACSSRSCGWDAFRERKIEAIST